MLVVAAGPDCKSLPTEFLIAIRSQGALAKYRDDIRKIVPMSLNHQKAVAAEVFGSYEQLDTLRRNALIARENRSEKPSRTTRDKASLQRLVSEQAELIRVLKEDLVLLQRAFDIRCKQAREYAERAGAPVVERCLKELREIESGLSLRRVKVEASNVTKIGRPNTNK